MACKEWNGVAEDGLNWSGNSYDNTGAVGHSTWRHVKFVEGRPEPGFGGNAPDLHRGSSPPTSASTAKMRAVWKPVPQDAIVRTEFGGVFIQPDVCNGCGYCVVACPFGVVQRNPDDGRVFKCTFCYDRQKVGLRACMRQACPTESIKFGPLERLQLDAEERLKELQSRGMDDAQLYDPRDSSVGGIHAMFIVRGDPRQYNLPPKPEVPTTYLQGRLDQFGSCGRVAAVRQHLRISRERKTMSSDSQRRRYPSTTHGRARTASTRFAAKPRRRDASTPSAFARQARLSRWPRPRPATTACRC